MLARAEQPVTVTVRPPPPGERWVPMWTPSTNCPPASMAHSAAGAQTHPSKSLRRRSSRCWLRKHAAAAEAAKLFSTHPELLQTPVHMRRHMTHGNANQSLAGGSCPYHL